MAKAVMAGLSPGAPEFDPRLVNVVFVVDRVALGPSTSVFPCHYHCPVSPHPYLSTCCCYQNDQREPSNSNIISEIAGRRTEGGSDISMLNSVK